MKYKVGDMFRADSKFEFINFRKEEKPFIIIETITTFHEYVIKTVDGRHFCLSEKHLDDYCYQTDTPFVRGLFIQPPTQQKSNLKEDEVMKPEVGQKWKPTKDHHSYGIIKYCIIKKVNFKVVHYDKYYKDNKFFKDRIAIEKFIHMYEPFVNEKQEEKKEKMNIHERREWFNKMMR